MTTSTDRSALALRGELDLFRCMLLTAIEDVCNAHPDDTRTHVADLRARFGERTPSFLVALIGDQRVGGACKELLLHLAKENCGEIVPLLQGLLVPPSDGFSHAVLERVYGAPMAAAAEVLSKLGRQAIPAVPELIRALEMGYGDALPSINNALVRIGKESRGAVVTRLLEMLQAGPRPGVDERWLPGVHGVGVLYSLGTLAAPEAVPCLIQLLRDERIAVRTAAAGALSRMGSAARSALEALRQMRELDPMSALAAREAESRILSYTETEAG